MKQRKWSFLPRGSARIINRKAMKEQKKCTRNESVPYVDQDGDIIWKNAKGQCHRLDGPAIDRADGSKAWWVNDKRHRLDGPAYEGANVGKEWWIDGVWYPYEAKWREKVNQLNKKK